MSGKGRAFGFLAFGFIGGILAAAGAALWLGLVSLEPEEREFEPTYFQVSLAAPHCETGRIDALVAERARLGGFRSDGLAERARICANHRFRPGSVDYVVHQIGERFRQCFELTLSGGVWQLALRRQSASVCRSSALLAPDQPVFFCLLQAAAPDWTEDPGAGLPRDCPAAVEAHFDRRLAAPTLR